MTQKIRCSGFGGQGIVLMGRLLAYAGMVEDRHTTFFPQYGAAMRGGTAICSVIISDYGIASPMVEKPDVVLIMNRPSLDKFEPIVASGGAVVVNSSLVARLAERDDLNVSYLPFNDLAASAGNPRTINMVALGAYLKASGAIPLEVARQAMSRMLEETGKAKLIDANSKALEEGYNAV